MGIDAMKRLLRRKAKRPMNIAILGSGPAGLFAAQAVEDTGNNATIISLGKRSHLNGAQYLTAPVPGLACGEPLVVNYIVKGSMDDYRRKVYGDENAELSPQQLEAWDIRAAYNQAWLLFSDRMRTMQITPRVLINGDWKAFSLVVWSIPLTPQCIGGHQFVSKQIWTQGDAPELDIYCQVTVPDSTVIVNGEDSPRWYRASNLFGHRTIEWPDGVKPPVEGIVKVQKPISTTCDCWRDLHGVPVLRVGRYGTWEKRQFSHMAYTRTRAAIEAM